MYKMDYHVHSLYSYDGEQSIEEMCNKMVQLGVNEVCLTEHFDLGHPDPECQGIPVWDLWEKEIQYINTKYPQITIKKGIEIGDNPAYRKQIQKYVSELQFDFLLLSLHLVNQKDPYNADVFFNGQTRKEAYCSYLLAIDDAVRNYTDYDSVAHIGYIGRYAPWKEDKAVKYEDAADIVDDILKCIIENDKCLEINTKGIDSHFIPDESIIKRYIELGGTTFTFGSDAHNIESNYFRIDDAKDYIKQLGGKYQAGFSKRIKNLHKL